MAEQQQNGVQNKLGELFVEFGSKGMPSLLKNLNNVSASFLLGKNAASQFADMLTKPMKEAGNAAIEIGKLNSVLGVSEDIIQKLQNFFKQKGLSTSLVNDLGKIAQLQNKLQRGEIGANSDFVLGLSKIGLDPLSYKGTFEDTLKMYKDVQRETDKRFKAGMISAIERSNILQQIGLSPEHAYAWDRGGFNIEDYTSVSSDVLERNRRATEALNELNIAFENLKITLVSEFGPAVKDIADWLTEKLEGIRGSGRNLDKLKNVGGGAAAGAAIGSVVPVIGTAAGAVAGIVVGATKDAIEHREEDWEKYRKERGIPNPKNKGTATGGAAPAFMDAGVAGIPPNLGSMTQNINITNQNNINGTNATEIADKLAGITSDDIQYAQYQANHLTNL